MKAPGASQAVEGSRRKHGQEVFCGFPEKELARQDKQTYDGLWGAEAVSSLTPGPRVTDGGKAVMVQSVRPPAKQERRPLVCSHPGWADTDVKNSH